VPPVREREPPAEVPTFAILTHLVFQRAVRAARMLGVLNLPVMRAFLHAYPRAFVRAE